MDEILSRFPGIWNVYREATGLDTIFITDKTWKSFSDSLRQTYIELVFHYYRHVGYPYYPVDEAYRRKQFTSLMKSDYRKLVEWDDDGTATIRQSMTGLGLAWSYFPHYVDVRCNNRRTVLEAFNNDEILRKAIDKRMKYGTYMSDSGMRKAIRTSSGTQGVSNFRPTAAAAIYSIYTESGDTVWDMSCGYGGRYLGAIMHGVNYYGTDPCAATWAGLEKMREELAPKGRIDLILKMGSEEFLPTPNTLDLCFTSPPYFSVEKYSDEPTQSYMKFPELDNWLEGFLGKTMVNCWVSLKPGKYMVINIAESLADATSRLAQDIGFDFIRTDRLALSTLLGGKKNADGTRGYKYEPILVFRKRNEDEKSAEVDVLQ